MANIFKKIFGKDSKEAATDEASENKQNAVDKTASKEQKPKQIENASAPTQADKKKSDTSPSSVEKSNAKNKPVNEKAGTQPSSKEEKIGDTKKVAPKKSDGAQPSSKQTAAEIKPSQSTPSAQTAEKKSSKAPTAPQTVKQENKKASNKTESAAQTAEVAESGTNSLMGKFIIKQAKDGSYMFNLKASNGEIIATSDMYSSLEKCRKGIASVQLNAPIANLEDHAVDGAVEEAVNPKFELYHDKGGDFRFRLKARNGSIIAKSQGYSAKSNCRNGIESVRKNAMSNEIVMEDTEN